MTLNTTSMESFRSLATPIINGHLFLQISELHFGCIFASPLAIGGVNAGTRISFGADFPRDRTEYRSVCSPGYKSLKLIDSLSSTPSKLPAIEQVQRRRSAIQDFFSLLVAIELHFIKALTITFLQTSAIMISIGMSSHLMHQ